MEKKSSRKKSSPLRVFFLLCAIILVVGLHWRSELLWRAQVVQLKLKGELDLSLAESLRAIAPSFSRIDDKVGFATLIRRDGNYALWNTPLGKIWSRQHEEKLVEKLLREMLVEEIYVTSDFPIKHGDIVLDIGSHLGVFTLLALQRGASRVICMEPEPENVLLFKRSFRNELETGKVVLIDAAAWKEIGTLQFATQPSLEEADKSARGQVSESIDHGISVRAVTIDSVVEELGLESVDFLKLDIEGAEADALKGTLTTLRTHKPNMAVAVYHRPNEDREEIIKVIRLATKEYALRVRNGIALISRASD